MDRFLENFDYFLERGFVKQKLLFLIFAFFLIGLSLILVDHEINVNEGILIAPPLVISGWVDKMFDELAPIVDISLKKCIPAVAADHEIDSLEEFLQLAV